MVEVNASLADRSSPSSHLREEPLQGYQHLEEVIALQLARNSWICHSPSCAPQFPAGDSRADREVKWHVEGTGGVVGF